MNESDIDIWAAEAVRKWKQRKLGPEDKLRVAAEHIFALQRYSANQNHKLSTRYFGKLVIQLEENPTGALANSVGDKAIKLYRGSPWVMPPGRVHHMQDISQSEKLSGQVAPSRSAVTQGLLLSFQPLLLIDS